MNLDGATIDVLDSSKMFENPDVIDPHCLVGFIKFLLAGCYTGC